MVEIMIFITLIFVCFALFCLGVYLIREIVTKMLSYGIIGVVKSWNSKAFKKDIDHLTRHLEESSALNKAYYSVIDRYKGEVCSVDKLSKEVLFEKNKRMTEQKKNKIDSQVW